MEILDAQVHPPLPLEPWGFELAGDAASAVAVELANAAMEAVGVDAALVYGSAPQCRAAAERYPGRFRGVLSVGDPAQLGDAGSFADEISTSEGLVGLRILGDAPQGGDRRRFLDGGRWEPLLDAAEDRGIPLVMFAPLRMEVIQRIARRRPRLRLVVDHLGLPPPPAFPRHPADLTAVAGLLSLSALPNVAVKLTGAPALSVEPFPFRDLWPAIRAIVDAFGPDRVMWGSDYTRVTGRSTHPRHPGGRHSYAQLLAYLAETELLRPSEKAAVLATTARQWFGWSR